MDNWDNNFDNRSPNFIMVGDSTDKTEHQSYQGSDYEYAIPKRKNRNTLPGRHLLLL